MIRNNFESSQQNLDLFPISGKHIEFSFKGEQISSDGGLLLVSSRLCDTISLEKDNINYICRNKQRE